MIRKKTPVERRGDTPGIDLDALDELQYRVTQEKATEAPFSGALLHNEADGTYACVACGNALFSSQTKYDSGSGWPSFWLPLAAGNIKTSKDISHGMLRTEVGCAACGAHLGHVFDDGPQPSGQRFCINSAALKFTQQEDS